MHPGVRRTSALPEVDDSIGVEARSAAISGACGREVRTESVVWLAAKSKASSCGRARVEAAHHDDRLPSSRRHLTCATCAIFAEQKMAPASKGSSGLDWRGSEGEHRWLELYILDILENKSGAPFRPVI